MFEVKTHEYDAARNIDTYEFDMPPGKTMVRINVLDDGTPQVLLGVAGMAVQINETAESGAEPSWTVCKNQKIIDIALADYNARQ